MSVIEKRLIGFGFGLVFLSILWVVSVLPAMASTFPSTRRRKAYHTNTIAGIRCFASFTWKDARQNILGCKCVFLVERLEWYVSLFPNFTSPKRLSGFIQYCLFLKGPLRVIKPLPLYCSQNTHFEILSIFPNTHGRFCTPKYVTTRWHVLVLVLWFLDSWTHWRGTIYINLDYRFGDPSLILVRGDQRTFQTVWLTTMRASSASFIVGSPNIKNCLGVEPGRPLQI